MIKEVVLMDSQSLFLAEIRKNIDFSCENFMFTAVKIALDDVLT